ncbi:MAG: ECF transporter S component [Firmicutes bacterium]|nr:ECF transporter S component [Bacillota bacterium]
MKTQKMVRLAVLIALCGVGGFIKIPSPTGTVALDSLPGYLAGILLGGWGGAIVGALGHLFSAWTVSLPFGLPAHVYVAVQMAIYVSIYGYLFRKGYKILAVIVAIILNGVVAAASFIPLYGAGFFAMMMPSLVVGSAVNIILATLLMQSTAIKKIAQGVEAK